MRILNLTSIARVAALAAVVGLSSCSQTNETATTSEPAPSTTTPDVAVAVSHIELGKSVDAEKRVTEQTHTFAPQEPIYATVLTNGAGGPAEVKARWTTETGEVVEESTQTLAPTGNNATAFQVSKPGGLAAGKYKVEIFLNGQPAGTQEFEVTTG